MVSLDCLFVLSIYEFISYFMSNFMHMSSYDPQVSQHCIDEIISISNVFQSAYL